MTKYRKLFQTEKENSKIEINTSNNKAWKKWKKKKQHGKGTRSRAFFRVYQRKQNENPKGFL